MNAQTQRIRQGALDRGFLDAAQLDAALARYQADPPAMGFGAYLQQQGLLTIAQLSALQPKTVMLSDAFAGKRFSGFFVGSKLGEGGMGVVHRCYHEQSGAQAVIKFLSPDLAAKRSWRTRFVATGRMLEGVQHPALLRVFAVESRGEHPYVIMELVEGETLEELLMRRGPLAGREVAWLGRELALGLEAAHEHGLVHRDIKPSNVSLGDGGKAVKLLDFDLAKSLNPDLGLTRAGQVMGTPHYMAPEQWGEHLVDARADLFSLGATLYHMATGYLPFQGQQPREISEQIRAGDYVPPRQRVPALPEPFEWVLHRLLEPDRDYRYQTARQVAEDLQHVLDGTPVNVPRLVELAGGAVHPLLRRATYTIGRDASCDLTFPDSSVSRRHAELVRHEGGYALRDVGSTAGTYVSGVKIHEARLKPSDAIHLGGVEVVFHDGGVSAAPYARPADAAPPVKTAPEPVLAGLQQQHDRRVTLWLLEQLAPHAQRERLEASRRALAGIFGAELAAQVADPLERRFTRLRKLLPSQLFAVTHENLGEDPAAWLRWWEEARAEYPGQLAPETPARRARLVVVGSQAAHFLDRDQLTLGRDAGAGLVLDDRTVSRHHATIVRLHQQLVIRDENSRFGLEHNGQRTSAAFLADGDRITLGSVELAFQREPLPPPRQDAQGAYVIDPIAFFLLFNGGHPAACRGALAFVEAQERVAWLLDEAARLFDDRESGMALADLIQRRYLTHVEPALALLTTCLGDGPTDAEAWRLELEAARLPPQVLPQGWFPASWE